MRIIIPYIPTITTIVNNVIPVQGFYDSVDETKIIRKLFWNVWYVGYLAQSERQATRILYELRTRCLIDYLQELKSKDS